MHFLCVRCMICSVLVQIDQYDVDTEKAVEKISRQLLEYNITTEGYGGEVPIVPVSYSALRSWRS